METKLKHTGLVNKLLMLLLGKNKKKNVSLNLFGLYCPDYIASSTVAPGPRNSRFKKIISLFDPWEQIVEAPNYSSKFTYNTNDVLDKAKHKLTSCRVY